MASSSSTSTTGVMSQHAVKVNPELPSVVTAAFERYQMGCLHDELAGPDERKLQALDIILDICRVDTKAQEGVMQGLLGVLVSILRGKPIPGVLTKVMECFLLLSKYPNARQKLVEDCSKLEEIRHAIQGSSTEKDFFNCFEFMRNLCVYPRGADALVSMGFWDWLISLLQPDGKYAPGPLRQSIYQSLFRLKTECNLDPKQTSTPKSLIRYLLTTDFTLAKGAEYPESVLWFCIAVCRLQENKTEFIQNDGIGISYRTFLADGKLQVSTRDAPMIQLVTTTLQFLSSLTVAVTGKKLVAEKIGPAAIATFFESCLALESGKVERTLTQFMLEVCEHPDIRAALRANESLVARLRSSEKRADEFGRKILQKLIDNIFWEP
mmetsp:Transcript_27717/g.69920  ORF Transcript_27717/g.69920 Transcript_27717/m.69920 type:complete len:380 (-) Transcript_27717:163-1302(-)|eukprot:CAMPEP_0178999452 /NCGR_PEP_ID=MMETSP0795-20121207/10072_1 /TAXON_ID=88552 /ORGANISM="Amoebophrya sp., Strain Ameob2" /LENGTH=379 /DNA_ID=CAMNT_0020692235 /DNA_START=486 /DNA_END=1625 /DNA_ORIENTATION=+